MNDPHDNLKRKTLAGMIWTFSDTIGTQAIQLLVQIILARLLLPRDFGIVGMILVFIALSNAFIDGGLTNGLIREKKITQEDYSTVFFFNLFTSVTLYLLLFFSSGIISRFFTQPTLKPLLRVVGLLLPISSFSSIQRIMLTKDIQFRVQTKINIISAILSGGLAIVFALMGFGVWSLAIKMLIMQLLQTSLFITVKHWKPSFTFSMRSFKTLFSFGSKVMVSELISTLYENIYMLIIGASFSATTLGYFSNARRLSEAAVTSITTAIHKVSYPVLSTVRLEEERLKRGYRQIIKASAFVIFPLLIGLIAIAPTLFEVILGDNWIPAIPYFQILCISGLLYPINSINANLLQVQGRSDLYLYLNTGIKVLGVVCITSIIFLGLGIYGLLWFSVIESCVSFFIYTLYSKKIIGYSFWEQVKDVSKSLCMSVSVAGIVFLLSSLYSENSVSLLLLQIISGMCLYILLSILLQSKEFQFILSTGYPLLKSVTQNLATYKRHKKTV